MLTNPNATMEDLVEFCREKYPSIPQETLGCLYRWVQQGFYPGDFLAAVFSNNLELATAYADSQNRAALADVCLFVHNNVPPMACKADWEGWPEENNE